MSVVTMCDGCCRTARSKDGMCKVEVPAGALPADVSHLGGTGERRSLDLCGGCVDVFRGLLDGILGRRLDVAERTSDGERA